MKRKKISIVSPSPYFNTLSPPKQKKGKSTRTKTALIRRERVFPRRALRAGGAPSSPEARAAVRVGPRSPAARGLALAFRFSQALALSLSLSLFASTVEQSGGVLLFCLPLLLGAPSSALAHFNALRPRRRSIIAEGHGSTLRESGNPCVSWRRLSWKMAERDERESRETAKGIAGLFVVVDLALSFFFRGPIRASWCRLPACPFRREHEPHSNRASSKQLSGSVVAGTAKKRIANSDNSPLFLFFFLFQKTSTEKK